jgi:hypothetical protein
MMIEGVEIPGKHWNARKNIGKALKYQQKH